MVVEDVEDLDLGVVGEAVVGDVELPAFVRGVRAEALVAGFRAFVRLRGDEYAGREDPPGRRDRWHGVGPVAVFEVGGDGRGAGLVPAPVELLRSATISSSVACGVRPGLSRGRRDRRTRSGSPSARNRCTRVITQRREIP